MTNKFIQLKYMRRSERENAVYFNAGKIILNLDHIISIRPNNTLTSYYNVLMTNDIEYVVDHSILEHFPLMGDEYLDQNIF